MLAEFARILTIFRYKRARLKLAVVNELRLAHHRSAINAARSLAYRTSHLVQETW